MSTQAQVPDTVVRETEYAWAEDQPSRSTVMTHDLAPSSLRRLTEADEGIIQNHDLSSMLSCYKHGGRDRGSQQST